MKTLPDKPDGRCADLPEGAVTRFYETGLYCPAGSEHVLTGSRERIYCRDCAVWWWREGHGEEK